MSAEDHILFIVDESQSDANISDDENEDKCVTMVSFCHKEESANLCFYAIYILNYISGFM